MDKVAFITGAASGIGAAKVRASSRAASATRSSWEISRLRLEKPSLLKIGGTFVQLNVREEAHFEAAFAAIGARHGRLDAMVNNAGIVGVLGPIGTLDIDQYDYTQEVVQSRHRHRHQACRAPHAGAAVRRDSQRRQRSRTCRRLFAACLCSVQSGGRYALPNPSRSSSLKIMSVATRSAPGNVATPIVTGVRDERWLDRIKKIPVAACRRSTDTAYGRTGRNR